MEDGGGWCAVVLEDYWPTSIQHKIALFNLVKPREGNEKFSVLHLFPISQPRNHELFLAHTGTVNLSRNCVLFRLSLTIVRFKLPIIGLVSVWANHGKNDKMKWVNSSL